MHPGKIVCFAVAILLVACHPSTTGTQAAIAAESTTPVAQQCPSQDFEKFLISYIGNSDVQKQFTSRPLQSDSIDADAEPEPQLVTAMLSDLQFPVIPGQREQKDQGLVMSTANAGNNVMVVKLVKPDTDYQVSYYFRHDVCWMLYRKSDESI